MEEADAAAISISNGDSRDAICDAVHSRGWMPRSTRESGGCVSPGACA
jgi:hypothetical protein